MCFSIFTNSKKIQELELENEALKLKFTELTTPVTPPVIVSRISKATIK